LADEPTGTLDSKAAQTAQKSIALDLNHFRTLRPKGNNCIGSDVILVWGSDNLVRDNLVGEVID